MRRTKIVATLGPASRARSSIRALIEAGVDVFRLNLAHDEIQTHEDAVALVREEARSAGRPVGLLVDLPGPKMRTGLLIGDTVTLEPGSRFELVGEDILGDDRRVGTTVEGLPSLVSVGDEIYLADGEIILEVAAVRGSTVVTDIVRGGTLRSRKGMHIPAADRNIQAFTETDRAALQTALKMKVDLVGLSFVRDADDLARAREALPAKGDGPLLVAKIETASALENLPEIVEAADAVMIARGDLGIQTPLRSVPHVQKNIIRICNAAGVPVITATEVLESMTYSPLPSRAEVTDIANAVLDGTDALMLSEETAVGSYPVQTVAIMSETAETAEQEPSAGLSDAAGRDDDKVSWAVAHAAVQAAAEVGAAAILCPTRSGATPRRVAAFRPRVPIVGLSDRKRTIGALTLVWGVIPIVRPGMKEAASAAEEVSRAVDAAAGAALIRPGELVVVVAGSPGPRAGRTDYMRIARC